MNDKSMLRITLAGVVLFGASAAAAQAPLSTAFTYQGQVKQGGIPLDGPADMQLSLWDPQTGGVQIGTTVLKTGVTITNGLFSVEVDFGTAALSKSSRWLEIALRTPTWDGHSGHQGVDTAVPNRAYDFVLFLYISTPVVRAKGFGRVFCRQPAEA